MTGLALERAIPESLKVLSNITENFEVIVVKMEVPMEVRIWSGSTKQNQLT